MEGMNSTDSAQDSPTPAHERTAASERPKKTYSLSNALVIAAFVAWVSKTIWGFRAILDPMRNITLVPGEPTLQNLWKQGTPVRFCALPHECVACLPVQKPHWSLSSRRLYSLHWIWYAVCI
jgi:hypothetical protein